MKHIIKNPEPANFIEWKNKANENWQPTSESLRGSPTGRIVKQSLIGEQGGLCCYCEQRISENDSHFEHFRPQSWDENESLNYQNLHCSCIREPRKGTDLHCGHFKGNQFCDQLISPLEPDCENQFSYDIEGRIIPATNNNVRAIETIKMLGLNNGDLPEKRKALIDVFYGGDRISLTENDVAMFSINDQISYAKNYLCLNDNNTFEPFWTTMNFLLTELLQNTNNHLI
jgi:uncharacterized protein (TIGR02646 family)